MKEIDGQIPAQLSIYACVVVHQQVQAHHGGTSLIIRVVGLELHLHGILDPPAIIHQEVVLMLTSRLAAEMVLVQIYFLQS